LLCVSTSSEKFLSLATAMHLNRCRCYFSRYFFRRARVAGRRIPLRRDSNEEAVHPAVRCHDGPELELRNIRRRQASYRQAGLHQQEEIQEDIRREEGSRRREEEGRGSCQGQEVVAGFGSFHTASRVRAYNAYRLAFFLPSCLASMSPGGQ